MDTLPAPVQQAVEVPVLAPPERSLVAIARTPDEMRSAQASLTAWAEAKIAREREDADELKANYDLAVKNKWRSATLKRHWQRAQERLVFWEKTKEALAAGYCMVPDMPVDVFAVRTTRRTPSAGNTYAEGVHSAWAPELLLETSEGEPAGEGRYVSPAPEEDVRNTQATVTDLGQYVKGVCQTRRAVGFQDVDFPFVLAKLQVLDATAQAMAIKVFDDLGVLPGSTHRSGKRPAVTPDPLVIGRVVLPACYGGPERRLSFVVAWFIDVRDLDKIR